MAKFKCWKKLFESFYMHKKKDEFLNIHKDIPSGYEIEILRGKKGIRHLSFKPNKSQALKFAKSYMKKHNIC